MARIQSIYTSDWGTPIETAARNVAGFLALIYTAGFVSGLWLHNLNDALASVVSGRKITRKTAPQPVAQPVIQNDAPVSADLEAIADLVLSERPGVDREAHALLLIHSLKVTELRRVARKMGYGQELYRLGRKGELISELRYCARSGRLDKLAAVLGI